MARTIQVQQFIHDMKPNFAKNAAASHLQRLAMENLLSSAFKEVRAGMEVLDDGDQMENYNRLLKSVTESVDKESVYWIVSLGVINLTKGFQV
jgi:hypothetical protein